MSFVSACVVASFAAGAMAATDPLAGEPEGERIALWPEGKVPSLEENQYNEPFIEWFVPSNKTTDAVMIVTCGGGYGICNWVPNGSMGGGFRDWLLEKGMTVVRLHHRTPRPKKVAKHVTAWQDAQRAVRLVRHGAAAHGVSPDKIGFFGYSAAGHLALLMALSSQTGTYEPIDEIDSLPCNIAFAAPAYPAYVLSDGVNSANTHGGDLAEDVILPEFKFDSATCPVFFMHGDADVISPMGSVKVYSRLHAMHVPCDLHVFAKRDHDFKSKGAIKGKFLAWRPLLWDWLVQMGFCGDVKMSPTAPSRTVDVVGPGGRAVVDLQGGRILSWKTPAGEELLFMPRLTESADGDWSHGGISVCWPWFGKKGDKASSIHGFARNRRLAVRHRDSVVAGGSSVTLGFSLAAGEDPDFPYAVDLELTLRMTSCLEMTMRTKNTGDRPFSFSEGIQPYFAVSRYGAVTLRGVKENDFTAVSGMDAAFPRRGDAFALVDAGAGRELRMHASGNTGVVVWSPGNVEPHNRNLDAGDTERFIGLGPSCRTKEGALELAPGQSHELVFSVEVDRYNPPHRCQGRSR